MPSLYLQTRSSTTPLYGANIGFAVVKGQGSFGLGVECLTHKDAGAFLPVYADLHLLLNKKNVSHSPFVALQPGYVVRSRSYNIGNNVTIKETGGLYFSGGLGFISKEAGAGITGMIKYSLLTTKNNSFNRSNTINCIAIQFGIAF